MSRSPQSLNRSSLMALGAVATVAALAAAAVPAQASVDSPAKTPAAYTVKSFAAVGSESNPDDVTRLGDSIYVTFQNGVGPLGEPAASGAASSTIQQYGLDGTPGHSWQVAGKVDGLTADAANRRLLLSANEDGNSSFHTLVPGAQQPLKTYKYQGLTHGGGTDAISIYHGRILVSASHPADGTGPAAYSVNLDGGTADLTPMFSDNAAATAANGAQSGKAVHLALTDPDSNTVVPAASPRFKGDFLLDGQGDQQLVFAAKPGSRKQALQVLSVSLPLDDTVFANKSKRTMWITDAADNKVYSVAGPFQPGQAVTSVSPDSGPSYLATLNLNDGSLAPIKELAKIAPKGLLFTGPAGDSERQDSQQ